MLPGKSLKISEQFWRFSLGFLPLDEFFCLSYLKTRFVTSYGFAFLCSDLFLSSQPQSSYLCSSFQFSATISGNAQHRCAEAISML